MGLWYVIESYLENVAVEVLPISILYHLPFIIFQ